MKHYFQAEQLKYRHTSVAAITLGMPVFTALLAFWLTSSYFSVDVYNWWYIGLYPGFLGILCSIIGKKDKQKKNYTIWSLPCGMEQIKSYKPSTNSISEGQVLSTPYPYDKAKLIVREMAEILMFRLTEKKLVTESITLEIGYDRENVDKGGYRGLTQTDRYGRIIPKAAHGTVRFDAPTNLGSTIINESAKLFERITDPALTVRRITINANKVTPDEGIYQVDFFTDTKKLEKEKKLQQAMLGIKNKYGKNAVLKASSYEEGATMRQRNAQIGGHSAGGSAGGSDGKLQK